MKVLLYSEGLKLIQKSGVGRAIKHQERALTLNNINYDTDPEGKDYDIVHINTVGPGSILLALRAKLSKKKVIMHAHSTEEDFRDSFFFSNPLSVLFKQWLIYSYKHANHIITPTPYSKRVLEGYNIGLPIDAVSNGVDLTKFSHNRRKGNAFRKKYGFSKKDKVIISVGLLIKRKGIFDFVEMARRMPEYQFVWCGDTSPLLQTASVKKLLKDLPKNAHFVGYVDDMVGAYSGSDIFFMPTYEETEGIVVLEALSARLPVIVRDIPVYEDWLEHNVHCYKGSSNNEFESLIVEAIDNGGEALCDNGYTVVEERTLEKVGHQLVEVYQSLV